MKRYVEVYWTPWTQALNGHPFIASHVLTQPPEPAISAILEVRPDVEYTKCPAVVEVCKNAFIVRSPVDMQFTVDHDTKQLTTDRFGQKFYDTEINNRSSRSNTNGPFLMSIFPRVLFYAKDSVELEQFDMFVLPAPANVKTIPGRFDISKWVRPVEWAVEIDPSVTTLSLKARDPLYMVRFITKDNLPVKLIRVQQTPDLVFTVNSCLTVKEYRPFLSLRKLYSLSRDHLKGFWRGSK